MVRNQLTQIVDQTNYPLYGVCCLGDEHIVIAGGGGSAKTGVPNRMEILRIVPFADGTLGSEKVCTIDTGGLAPMNVHAHKDMGEKSGALAQAVAPLLLASGQDRYCKVYALHEDLALWLTDHAVPYSRQLVCGKPGADSAGQHNGMIANGEAPLRVCLGFAVKEYKSLQTDSHPKSPFQKVVRFGPDGSYFITGGADGHFRIWDIVTGKKIVDHNAHKDEIDDIAVCPDGQCFLTIGRDSKAYAWSVKDGSKICEIPRPPKEVPEKCRFRTVKFGKMGRQGTLFFTASIPIVKGTRGQMSYIAQWLLADKVCKPLKLASVDKTTVCAMAVSADGAFLGLGDMVGNVEIWSSMELKPLRRFRQVHQIFVTGLEFLPPPPPEAKIAGPSKLACTLADHQCSLISISADNTVQLHVLPKAGQISCSAVLLLLAMFTCLCGFFISYLEL